MTATIIENETIEHLDFDSVPPCECMFPDECGREAEIITAVKCCGHKVLLSEECLFACHKEWEFAKMWSKSARCKLCNTYLPITDFPLIVLGRL